MKRSFFLSVVAGFILDLSNIAYSMSDISASINFHQNTDTAGLSEAELEQLPVDEQINIRTLMTTKGDDYGKVTDIVRQMVEDARLSNPDLAPIEVVVVAPDGDNREPVKLATIIGEYSEDTNVVHLTTDPTKEFGKFLQVSDIDQSLIDAHDKTNKFTTVMSWVRFAGTASVTLAVSIVIGELPLQAMIAGSLTAGALSGKLHRLNHQYNEFLGANPFWDKDGELYGSGKYRWKAARWGWNTFGKHGTLVAGYLTTIHFVMAAAGGPFNYGDNPIGWMAGTWMFGGLSAMSSGAWKRLDSSIYLQKLKENRIKYYGDSERSAAAYTATIRTSGIATLLGSWSSVFCESFRLSPDMFLYTATAMTINGILGWTTYLLKTQTKFFERANEKIRPIHDKAKTGVKNIFAKIKGPCQKLFSNQ